MAALRVGTVLGLVRELAAAGDPGHVAVTGPRGLADALRRELARGGDAGAVREGPVEGAAALVHVLAAAPGEDDRTLLKTANRARVPVVVVLAGPGLDDRVPYVLATDVVQVPSGSGFPVERIAAALAAKLGEEATALAARLPVLREPVVSGLIERFSRKNAAIGAAVFMPGADFPVMTLNQLRMVLRIAHAHGVDIGQERAPEVLATLGGGYAFRALARRALLAVPVAGWVVRGAVGYTATRTVGEAARRYFATAPHLTRS